MFLITVQAVSDFVNTYLQDETLKFYLCEYLIQHDTYYK